MNTGHDPMLSSFDSEGWLKKLECHSGAPSPMGMLTCTSNPFSLSIEGLLSPEHSSSLTDFWSNDRKRAPSVKEEDDDFTSTGCPDDEKADREDVEVDEVDIEDSASLIKTEILDPGYGDSAPISSNKIGKSHSMSEAEARRFVDEEFHKIAFIPNHNLSHKEKIEFILSKSDCKEYKVNDILQFDKRCKDSAKACAKIVQNIPQRYRWECVEPEDIPCCYTIVADCKKLSFRDKPPRPMNAFMIWAQGARRMINELCPKMQNAIISEALGDCWRNKSEAFKKKFEDEKNQLRRFHNVEFPEYKYKPKTKVQKAREKEELTLNKAKMRALVKREKVANVEAAQGKKKPHGNAGRPRKVQGPKPSVSTKSPKQTLSKSSPAIRDMLSLKISKDKLLKDHISTPSCHSRFGQLSPIEADSPKTMDRFEDAGHHDTDVSETQSKGMSSSVFDTPANTPPFDDSHEPHHSPVAQATSPSPLTVISTPSYTPISQATINYIMPSISAVLASPIKSASTVSFAPASTSSVPVTIPVTIPISVISIPAFSSSKSRVSSQVKDLFLFYGKDSKPASFKSLNPTSSGSHHFQNQEPMDSQESDCNNNHASVANNNTDPAADYSLGHPPTYSLGMLDTMLVSTAPSDLDSLFDLDIQSPLLSDDQMNQLISDANF
ncbi:uncharacterized protein LOC106064295 [Biomphalaria glabrata]|uniref:Sex-determining region Y protein n=1 Tax=Biomphalaria glabrata TaxID=6526 RepID=A0A9U8E9C0_BIOGL|nr:uncharacterized protein LOC106064295 [Biomphalaria glabrata]XP_013078249.2 uncharacterized protein LOC106064295 [Biomphalaria glabrata]